MNSFLAVVCLISGLVTPGYALFCMECSDSYAPFCTGNFVSCASNRVCISVFQASSSESEVGYYFLRGCGEKRYCGISGAVAEPNGKFRLSATCCESDLCTPVTPVLPPLSHNQNGKTCPYCWSDTGRDCTPTEYMNCTGDETHCMLYSTEETAGLDRMEYSSRGCASKGFCDMGTWTMESGDARLTVSITCSASTALYSALVILILATASLKANVF